MQLNQQDGVTKSPSVVVRIECAKDSGGSVIVDCFQPSNPKVLLCLTVKAKKKISAFSNSCITCKSGMMA